MLHPALPPRRARPPRRAAHLALLAALPLSALLTGCTVFDDPSSIYSEPDTSPDDTGQADAPQNCPDGLASCGDVCVNILASPFHCGSCGVECDPFSLCEGGQCVDACVTGAQRCGDDERCVTVASDPLHCGDCDTVCALDEVCNDGQCEPCAEGDCAAACDRDLNLCDRSCTTLANDTQHCGACDAPCLVSGAVAACVSGACGIDQCLPQFGDCNDDPRDGCEAHLRTDAQRCGACDNACAPDQLCSRGACVDACDAGLEACGAGCFDLLSSEAHCGGCDQPCGADQACVGGVCVIDCAPGFTECNGACVDPLVDVDHCDTCNRRCRADDAIMACNGGECVLDRCEDSRADCNDAILLDGCEVDLRVDMQHCGACGAICDNATEQCVDGACVPL